MAEAKHKHELPPELYLGKVQGEWPVITFTTPEHAASWLSERIGGRKQVWRCSISVDAEMTITDPIPPQLVEKEKL